MPSRAPVRGLREARLQVAISVLATGLLGLGLYLGDALTDPPAGDYDLTVTVVDSAGNAIKDSVRFTLLPEGSEDPDTDSAADTDTDTDSDSNNGDGGCRTLAAPPGLLALLLLIPRRRRGR